MTQKDHTTTDPVELPPLLTVREAGRLLGVSHTAAYAMDSRGELPTFGTGQRRVVKARLLAVISELSVA